MTINANPRAISIAAMRVVGMVTFDINLPWKNECRVSLDPKRKHR